jgi:hypothetical protein
LRFDVLLFIVKTDTGFHDVALEENCPVVESVESAMQAVCDTPPARALPVSSCTAKVTGAETTLGAIVWGGELITTNSNAILFHFIA